MNQRHLTQHLAIGGQPAPADIETLKATGIRTVVNVRTLEDDGYLVDEERLVENAGLNYAEVAVSPQLLDDIAVQRFSQALESDGAQPAYVHCGSGGRAGLMVLLHLAVQNGWTLREALEEGEKMRVAPSETSPYRAFFESYIQRHSAGERSGESSDDV